MGRLFSLACCPALWLALLLAPVYGFAHPRETGEEGADTVRFSPAPFVYQLQSRVETGHQSPRIIDDCRAVLKKDGTLELTFPPQFPAYYITVTITVKDGRYTASAGGVPLGPSCTASYRTLRQELRLQKDTFTPGERIDGYCNIDFLQTTRPVYGEGKGRGLENYFSWRGPFVAIIREEGFEPLADTAVAGYDIDLAHYELGPSLHAVALTPEPAVIEGRMEYVPLAAQVGSLHDAGKLESLRRNFLQNYPELKSKQILEVTWDTSPEADVSDGGRDRLTIWFQPEDGRWLWRYHRKWLDSE